MGEILKSYVIDPGSLRSDDFNSFFKAREEVLLSRIEKAMGKPIARDMMIPEATALIDFEEEFAAA